MELSSGQALYIRAHLSALSGLTVIQTLCMCRIIDLHFFADGFESFNVSVATSQNGWTDDFIGAEWFEKSFIPQSTA